MKLQSILRTLVVAVIALLSSPLIFGQAKIALVIGIANYEKVTPLRNALNDAHDIASTLKGKGFQVIELYDAQTKKELQEAVRKYFALLQGQTSGVGLVFYSGHGMQVDGDNYLIPIQADLQIKADVDDQCLNMSYIMSAIEEASNSLNIFILDACRNNPFRGFSRSGEKGLNMVNAPRGSYIVYATKPGSVASDGTGDNGLFTSKLLQYMDTPDLNIEQVFKRVAADVASESGDAQRPWISSDYTGDFYFTPDKLVATAAVPSSGLSRPTQSHSVTSRSLDYGYGPSNITLKIGKQEWIGKNLNVSRFANGDIISEAKTRKEWKAAIEKRQPAWCYYENDTTNGVKYGKLYNWFAVADERGLAPSGWHIPSVDEWQAVLGVLSAGEKGMKYSLDIITAGADNALSKFRGMAAGYRDNGAGGFAGLDDWGMWWTSSRYLKEGSNDGPWFVKSSDHNHISTSARTWISAVPTTYMGASVRCIRD